MLHIFKKKSSIFILIFFLAQVGSIFAKEEVPPPKIYHTGEAKQLKNDMKEAILRAKQSILIFTFSFSDIEFIQLVNKKAEEGVPVTIIINKDHRLPLLTHGSGKLKIGTRISGEGRIHHKILVVDHKDIWLGSANFTTSAFESQENMVVQVQSDIMAHALSQEAQTFFSNLQTRHNDTPPCEQFDQQKATLYLLPHGDLFFDKEEKLINETGKKALISLIDKAKKNIRIAMMVWTDQELAQAVLKAHKRGVHVEILLQDTLDIVAIELKRAGIDVRANAHQKFMHNKWMSIDESILVNGSANWSKSSFSRNDESFIVLENLNEEQKTYISSYWNHLVSK